jgi:hypothetical protein
MPEHSIPQDSRGRGLASLNALGSWRAALFFAAVAGSLFWAGLALTFGIVPVGPGLTNRLGGVAAGDFMFFYSSGMLAAEGRAADVYNPEALTAAGRATLGNVPELVWPYPPTLTLPLSALGRVSPALALWLWVGVGAAALLVTGRLALGSWRAAPSALLFPGSAFALFAGQLSPLLALCVALVIRANRQPSGIAGVALGMLAWKPHLAVVPAFLAGHARTRFMALAVVLVLVAASLAAYGVTPWVEFVMGGLRHSEALSAETPTARFVTNFSAASTNGVNGGWALAVHVVAGSLGVWAGTWLWLRHPVESIRAVGFVGATFQMTPYALDYDLVLFVWPWLIMLRNGLAHPGLARSQWWPWMFLTLLVPLSYLTAIYTGRSCGGPLMLIALGWLAWSSRSEPAPSVRDQGSSGAKYPPRVSTERPGRVGSISTLRHEPSRAVLVDV